MKKLFYSKKLTALFLCFAFLFPLCSIGAFGLEEKLEIPYALSSIGANTSSHISRVRSHENDQNTLVFLNQDSTKTMYLFSEPVKYKDASGDVVDKDATLVSKDNGYGMKANDIDLLLPYQLNDGVVLLYREHSLKITPNRYEGAPKGTLSRENSVSYPEVFGADTVMECTPALSGVRVDLAIGETAERLFADFSIAAPETRTEIDEEGNFLFFDRIDGQLVFTISDILFSDKDGKRADGAFSMEEKEIGQYLLAAEADQTLLSGFSYPLSISFLIHVESKDAVSAIRTSAAETDLQNPAINITFPGLYERYYFLLESGAEARAATLSLYHTQANQEQKATTISLLDENGQIKDGYVIEDDHPDAFSYCQFDLAKAARGKEAASRISVSDIATGFALQTEGNVSVPYSSLGGTCGMCLSVSYIMSQTSGITSGCTFIFRNRNTSHVMKVDDYTCIEAAFDRSDGISGDVLFKLVYDSTYDCYYMLQYGTTDCFVTISSIDTLLVAPLYQDPDNAWYIYSIGNGYYRLVPYTETWNCLACGPYGVGSTFDLTSNFNSYAGQWQVFLSVNAKNIKQSTSTNCSAATALQALYGAGLQGYVSGSTDAEKQATLYQQILNYGNTSAPILYEVTGVLTYTYGLNYTYRYISLYNSQSEQAVMKEKIKESLELSCAPFIIADTEYLTYYNNNAYDHYICIAGIDIGNNDNILLNDCFNLTDHPDLTAAFNGVHIAPIGEVYDACKDIFLAFSE